jgi:UDP-N-acetylmuramoyl-tripeptide--D-alanyl-D-alanine ligase
MTIEALYNIYLQYPSVVTDTRKIKQGDIFFALKGPSFNGNSFAAKAFESGAAFCVCDEVTNYKNDHIIYVDDVLSTLQALAKHHRAQFNIPFIAITGSNGKTTTKELMHAVLSQKYICYTTEGNLNNHIGVPITILKIKQDAEIAVIEMGANHQKEIESYCTYAMPTHGLINNCGKAHLEGFGGIEGVRKGKGELYDYIRKNGGTIFINTDFDYLVQMAEGIPQQVTYGITDAEYTGEILADKNLLAVKITNPLGIGEVHTQLAGNYNLPNVLSAVCVGKHFNVPNEMVKAALEAYTPSNSRSQILKHGTNTILLDAYNANPSSMKVAIENFAAMEGENKVLILGGMMELGDESLAEHNAIVDLIGKYNWSKIVLTGKDYTNLPSNFLHFNTTDETVNWFKAAQIQNTFILIKGSRSMAMERILS